MMLRSERYRHFNQRPIGDVRKDSQALLALTTDSRDTVTATLEAGIQAGGNPEPSPPNIMASWSIVRLKTPMAMSGKSSRWI